MKKTITSVNMSIEIPQLNLDAVASSPAPSVRSPVGSPFDSARSVTRANSRTPARTGSKKYTSQLPALDALIVKLTEVTKQTRARGVYSMSSPRSLAPATNFTAWREILDKLQSLLEGENNVTSNLANAAAQLFYGVADAFGPDVVNWVGFYLNDPTKEGHLVLGPFVGRPACLRIAYGRGVCGEAAAENATKYVEDVKTYPNYISCDDAAHCEIVVPLHDDRGKVVGVLDIDGPRVACLEGTVRFWEEAAQIVSASIRV